MKKLIILLFAVAMCLVMSIPSFAHNEEIFADTWGGEFQTENGDIAVPTGTAPDGALGNTWGGEFQAENGDIAVPGGTAPDGEPRTFSDPGDNPPTASGTMPPRNEQVFEEQIGEDPEITGEFELPSVELATAEEVMAAYNEIKASIGDIILDADVRFITFAGRYVEVLIADGYGKEYVQILNEKYAPVVIGITEAGPDGPFTLAEIGQNWEGGDNDIAVPGGTAPDISGALGGESDFDGGGAGSDRWILIVSIAALMGVATVVFVAKTRPSAARVASNGEVIADSGSVTKKQAVEAVKNSAVTPQDEVFDALMQRIDDK
jgi:hypothetical protein